MRGLLQGTLSLRGASEGGLARMKSVQMALMPGTDDKIGYWLTPPDLMDQLQLEFEFNFDACPYPRPAGFDGLVEDWGLRTWVNPPFRGRKMAWVRKAISEWKQGKLVVLILGAGNLSHALDPLVGLRDIEIRLLKVRWQNPAGKSRYDYTAMLFVFRPSKRPR
jgi:hypothetical protein